MIEPEGAPAVAAPRRAALLGIDPSAPTPYHRVVYAAVVDYIGEALLEAASPQLFLVRSADAKVGVAVVELGGPDDEALAKHVRGVLGKWSVEQVALVVIGPSGDAARFAEAAKPMVTQGTVTLGGFDAPGGEPWGELPEGPLRGALDPDRTFDWARFSERIEASRARVAARSRFGQRLAARPTRVTYALVVVNVLFFGLQVFFGGEMDPSVPLLVRMGGVSGALVAEGEVWRLVSSAFLHGGLMHLGFNMLVLVIIGRLIERVIGPQRFLILYTACALAGAMASALVMDAPVSVGASGALWGVLAAEGVLAFAPGFLPASIVPAAKRAAVINLVLNVANSFRPHVDWAAHFGGGVVGAALLWFVLSRGVPRGEALTSEDIRPLPGGKVIAGVCALLLAVGAIAGPVMGRAWEMREATPSYERVEVSEVGASLELPRGLSERGVELRDGVVEVTFGDLTRDRVMVTLSAFPITEDARGYERERGAIRAVLAEPPEQGRILSAVEDLELGGREATRVGYGFENDLRLDRLFLYEAERFVRIDVYYWSSEAEYGEGIAERAASAWR